MRAVRLERSFGPGRRGPRDADVNRTLATNDVMARGGDDCTVFRDIEPVLPVADSPALAHEVIDYIVSIGTVRSAVVGRIVVS
jgi:hypothetical protein